MNALLAQIRKDVAELEGGFSGALNISNSMDEMIGHVFANCVPPPWAQRIKANSRKPLGEWFADMKSRHVQFTLWAEQSLRLLPSMWIAGLFNPNGFITACMQAVARANGTALTAMAVQWEVTIFTDAALIEAPPAAGSFVHGLFLEGAGWDVAARQLCESKHTLLHTPMPVLLLSARVTLREGDDTATVESEEGCFGCPVYTTTSRGGSFVFAVQLNSSQPAGAWVRAGVALLMQPDYP